MDMGPVRECLRCEEGGVVSDERPQSPIEMMIDTPCCAVQPPGRRQLTETEKEACAQLGRDVPSDLRTYYPDVVKTRPTTWPVHLRNTIASKAEAMIRLLNP
jgi:hypothetical protein